MGDAYDRASPVAGIGRSRQADTGIGPGRHQGPLPERGFREGFLLENLGESGGHRVGLPLDRTGVTYVPFSVDALRLFDVKSNHVDAWCHAHLRDLSEENVIADLSILAASGQVVATLEGFCLRQITRAAVGAPVVQTGPRTPDRALQPIPDGAAAGDSGQSMPSEGEMLRYLQSKCAELSGYPESEIRPDEGFLALGLDSIVAAILANHILRDFGRRVTIGQILASSSIASLTREIRGVGVDSQGIPPVPRLEPGHWATFPPNP